ncbi:hypothetical protein MN608_11851 [Microdochium nivale]|nr:hypothetical protein MN608_11851 [Microdochium nivale]
MDKCWFVLRQAHYAPPQYSSPTRALGKTTSGDLRLGDAVTSPAALYPLLSQGTLPLFTIDMRISSTQLCEFEWAASSERGIGGSVAAGAPVATAAGITLGAELTAEFKKTVGTWAKFAAVDTEVVQPSRTYIDKLIAMPEVQEHIKHQNKLRLNQWTIYVVTGLMIARAGGTVGHSQGQSRSVGGGPDVDFAGLANANVSTTYSTSTEESRSSGFQDDRVWAVRFAKVHKGFLRSRWMQTEVTAGAALDGGDDEAEEPQEVLKHEGLENVEVVDLDGDEDTGGKRFVFVEGNF